MLPKADSFRILTPNHVNTNRLMIIYLDDVVIMLSLNKMFGIGSLLRY